MNALTEAQREELEREVLPLVRSVQRRIRDEVLAACRREATEALSRVAAEEGGDTIYAIDKVSEALLLEEFGRAASSLGGIVLVAEGLPEGSVVLPAESDAAQARYRVIVDPIDGTRGLMYQKRSAWVLTGVALNRGDATSLSDIVLAVQTEIPTLKQYLCDELSAVRGGGVHARRVDVLRGTAEPLAVAPSRATGIEHGFAMVSRFFPGARDELAAIDEEVVKAVLGPPRPGRAACFEEQYSSSGGQLYELMVGHDRFNADLRPLLEPLLRSRGEPPGLYCHPYDVCTALIAEEAGVIVTAPDGSPLDPPLSVDAPVAWVGYANAALRALIEPALHRALSRRGLLLPAASSTR
jgi:fructose-1,6-bisphosphatase/inositol monophosphatase family enzyme